MNNIRFSTFDIILSITILLFIIFLIWTSVCAFIGAQSVTPYIIHIEVSNESMSPINALTPDIFAWTPYWDSVSATNCSYDEYGIFQTCNTSSTPILVIEALTWNKSLALQYGERFDPNNFYSDENGDIVRCGKDLRNFIGQLGSSTLCNCHESWIRHRGFRWSPWDNW